jgi:hypothetical protein
MKELMWAPNQDGGVQGGSYSVYSESYNFVRYVGYEYQKM